MADSFLDRLPDKEKRRLKRMMSESAYEALRNNVKGPEDLKKEMEKGEQIAELSFTLESEPQSKEELMKKIEKDLREHPDKVVEQFEKLPADVQAMLREGKFAVQVQPHPATSMDTMVLVPLEEQKQEKIPLVQQYQDECAALLLKKKTDHNL